MILRMNGSPWIRRYNNIKPFICFAFLRFDLTAHFIFLTLRIKLFNIFEELVFINGVNFVF